MLYIFQIYLFVDPENGSNLTAFERIHSKNCRGSFREQRARTVDDFMKGNKFDPQF